ncbi:MAG: hypothetical protein ACXV3A_02400 [Kineosporiaceae bacterium]
MLVVGGERSALLDADARKREDRRARSVSRDVRDTNRNDLTGLRRSVMRCICGEVSASEQAARTQSRSDARETT